MSDLTLDRAREWWRLTLAGAPPRMVVLMARDDAGVLGTVQLVPAWPPNQPHRGDVAKLIVHRRARHRGVARALMEALERHAREEGVTLLLLDTGKGGAAEQVYPSLG